MGSINEDNAILRASRNAIWVGMAIGAAGGFFSGYLVGHSNGERDEYRRGREITLRQRENDARLLGLPPEAATRFLGVPANRGGVVAVPVHGGTGPTRAISPSDVAKPVGAK